MSRVGNVNHMPDHRKKKRVLHVNMLQKWHQPLATVFLAQKAAEEMEQEEVPAWNKTNDGQRGSQLTTGQNQELESLLSRFRSVFQSLPGHTTVTEHRIVTAWGGEASAAGTVQDCSCSSSGCPTGVGGDAGPWDHRTLFQ